MNGNGMEKYFLTFIHESKYNFCELCFKGYKILRLENKGFFCVCVCILQFFSFSSNTFLYFTFFYPHYA